MRSLFKNKKKKNKNGLEYQFLFYAFSLFTILHSCQLRVQMELDSMRMPINVIG